MIKGIGTDIVQNSRVNLKIAKKVLTDQEMEIFLASNNQQQFLASRFCAKEAVIKATNKKYNLSTIEILNNEDGVPICNIKGVQVSISHENDYSVAFAIWEE